MKTCGTATEYSLYGAEGFEQSVTFADGVAETHNADQTVRVSERQGRKVLAEMRRLAKAGLTLEVSEWAAGDSCTCCR